MATFVMFWAAVFIMFFFIAGTFCKVLASAIRALLSSLSVSLMITILVILAIAALYFIVYIVEDMIGSSLIAIMGKLFLYTIILGILFGIFSVIVNVGKMLLEPVLEIATNILNAVLSVLEGAASVCEERYTKFLRVLIDRAKKC